jgi:hypothetical protein
VLGAQNVGTSDEPVKIQHTVRIQTVQLKLQGGYRKLRRLGKMA